MPRPGTARALELLQQVAADTGIDVKSLQDWSPRPIFAMARREFCTRAHAEGLPRKTIAETIRRHYTTVLYHVSEDVQRRKREIYRRQAAAQHA